MPFDARVTLGKTGLVTSPLGLSSGYGLDDAGVARAFERGVRYFYFGSMRGPAFGRGVAALGARRDEATLVVQSYTRAAWAMRGSLERALRTLKTDRADVLLLGWWNRTPPERILDAAAKLRDAGLARAIMVSGHDRPTLATIAADPRVDAIMVRYNAAHPGAEREVFPQLGAGGERRTGVVAYTATRWGALVDPRRMPAGENTPRASDCYRFALSHPSVDVCLIGPRNAAELDEALATLERGPMSEEELAWMKRVGAVVHEKAKNDGHSLALRVLDRIFAT